LSRTCAPRTPPFSLFAIYTPPPPRGRSRQRAVTTAATSPPPATAAPLHRPPNDHRSNGNTTAALLHRPPNDDHSGGNTTTAAATAAQRPPQRRQGHGSAVAPTAQ